MKIKRLGIFILTSLCMCCLSGGIAALAAENEVKYTKIPGLEGHITASSVLNNPTGDMLTWELSKLANSQRGVWTAQWGYTSNPSADEWIKIDLQATKKIGKIALHNEQENCYARKLVVFGSIDGNSWAELARYENGDSDWADDQEVILKFPATNVRYVKISLREKGLNGSNYLVSMSNIEIFETSEPISVEPRPYSEIDVSVQVDSSMENTPTDLLTDGESADQTSTGKYWSSGIKNNAATDTDELVFDAGSIISFGGMSLFPRCATTDSATPCSVYGFPKSFTFSASTDGKKYFPINGQQYLNYEAGLSWNDFMFNRPVQAQFIKMSVTERGAAGNDFLTQFAEIKAFRADYEIKTSYSLVKPIAATSSGNWTADTSAEKAFDGNYDTSWVASWGYSSHKFADEYICYEFDANKIIGKIDFYVSDVNVPGSFRVLVSEDGKSWGSLLRVDSAEYNNKKLSLVFDSVNAKFVKIEVYQKGQNGANWLAGFTEIDVFETDEAKPAANIEHYEDITANAEITVSSTNDPVSTPKTKLTDGITANTNASSNYWMSGLSEVETVDGSKSDTGFDGLYFSFPKETDVDSLWIFPRFDGVPGDSIGFPVSFTIMYSQNGEEWYKIHSYNNYEIKAGWNEFAFPGRVNAKYIGLFVQKRGMNGKFYTIEFSEIKLMKAAENRNLMQGEMCLDTSSIAVTPYESVSTLYTYEEFRLKLSDHFKYSLTGKLNYKVEQGIGEIKEINGDVYYAVMPTEKGKIDVSIVAQPEGKQTPQGKLDFSLTVSTKDDPDVIALEYKTNVNYAVGVVLKVDCSELFIYEGVLKLVYSTDKGEIKQEGDKIYLFYQIETAGELKVTVSAMPEGREDKKVSNIITVLAVDEPTKEPQQPPVYGPEEAGGCGASIGASAFAAFAIGMVAIAGIGRKRNK